MQEDDPRSYLREVAGNLEKLSDRPTLILWGTTDFVFGESERARFERIFPDHVSVLFDKASHFLQEDKGERIAEATGSEAPTGCSHNASSLRSNGGRAQQSSRETSFASGRK